MHFFDPTVDWPSELQNQEIPDLLFVRSHKLIDVNFNFPSPSLAGSFSQAATWSEYASFDGASTFVKILLFKPSSIESDDEDHVNAILEDIVSRNGDVEIAQYRKLLSDTSLHHPHPPLYIGCRASYDKGIDTAALSPTSGSSIRRVSFKLQAARENQGLKWEPPPYLLLEEIEDRYFDQTSVSSSLSFSFSNGILLRLLGGSHERETSSGSGWTNNRIEARLTAKAFSPKRSQIKMGGTEISSDGTGMAHFVSTPIILSLH